MLNDMTAMGRLVRNPELRHTGSGTAVCSFTLAVERDGKPGENGERAVDYIDCVAWRGSAEWMCKYLAKGRMVVAAGRMQTRTWTDRHEQRRKETELVVSNMYFGDSKRLETAEKAYSTEPEADPYAEIGDEDGELPF